MLSTQSKRFRAEQPGRLLITPQGLRQQFELLLDGATPNIPEDCRVGAELRADDKIKFRVRGTKESVNTCS